MPLSVVWALSVHSGTLATVAGCCQAKYQVSMAVAGSLVSHNASTGKHNDDLMPVKASDNRSMYYVNQFASCSSHRLNSVYTERE